MPIIQADKLTNFVNHTFQAAGLPKAHAQRVANSLVTTNLAGHDSHGVVRVIQYLQAIEIGELNPTAEPTIAHETSVIASIDAKRCPGQVAAHKAISIAIEKAQEHGLAAVSLFNSGHVGRLGEWVEMAAVQGMIGLAFCNGGSPGGLVAPYGGAERRLGTNPFAAGIPQKSKSPILIDFATSMVAEGKVRVARNAGKTLPEGRILDKEGQPSTDPNDFYEGGMLLPAGEHKGYSLSLLMELLGGILTGGGSSVMPEYVRGNGVLFIVLAVNAFLPLEAFLVEEAQMIAALINTPLATGHEAILMPGDPERQMAQKRLAEGIPIDETTWLQLTKAASRLAVIVPSLES